MGTINRLRNGGFGNLLQFRRHYSWRLKRSLQRREVIDTKVENAGGISERMKLHKLINEALEENRNKLFGDWW